MVVPAIASAGSAVIPRNLAAEPGLSFDALKAEAIDAVQRFAGEAWTDFNAHDPGVTIIEQLCYALTDLGYRADFPIADLLARPAAAVAPGFGLPPPWRALATPPVTATDIRRLLLDRVAGLGNVWLTPSDTGSTGTVKGLYDIRVHAALPLPGVHPGEHPRYRRLTERVRRMFVHHRPLSEDIGSIRVLRPLRTVVSATLHLDRSARPEAVMAAALFRLALAMAPEPHRAGLASVATGAAPDALFDGPLPVNGFLPPGELADKPSAITVTTLADDLAGVPGVLGVRGMGLWVEGAGVCADGNYTVDRDHYCSVDGGLDGDGSLPLVLTVGGRPCVVDRGEVLRRLLDLWNRHRQRFALKAAYRRAYPMPQGRVRDLQSFTPLAAHFPAVYGLGNGHDPPADAPAGQLLGYLAIFEMIMVDYCDRLADLGNLVAGAPMPDSAARPAALAARIPALAHLSVPDDQGDTDAGARPRMPAAQYEALLDFLLALVGEDAGDVPVPPPLRPGSTAGTRHRIAVKRALLRLVTALAQRRGRGVDYLARPAARRIAGPELRARVLLGDHDPANARRRRRVALVEHVMLRPRSGTRRDQEGEKYQYAMAVSAVIQLPRAALADGDYRRQVETMLRDDMPAHLGLHVHFVDRDRWRTFRRLHQLWCAALRVDEMRAIDWCSVRLRDLLEQWSREEPA